MRAKGASAPGGASTGQTPGKMSTPASPAGGPIAAPVKPAGTPLKVLCIGAHPDDPESGCGGTLARFAKRGHNVTVLYMTRGENDMEGRSFEENGKIREREAITACKILGATPRFLGMKGGECEVTNAWRARMTTAFDEIQPDVIFAHWPLDTHPDHQVAAILSVHAYLAKPRSGPLYFFEVETGRQTIGFEPHVFVEIGDVLRTKSDALMAHVSQHPEHLYEAHHEPMERFRAREIAGVAAEAFAVMPGTISTGFMAGL